MCITEGDSLGCRLLFKKLEKDTTVTEREYSNRRAHGSLRQHYLDQVQRVDVVFSILSAGFISSSPLTLLILLDFLFPFLIRLKVIRLDGLSSALRQDLLSGATLFLKSARFEGMNSIFLERPTSWLRNLRCRQVFSWAVVLLMKHRFQSPIVMCCRNTHLRQRYPTIS